MTSFFVNQGNSCKARVTMTRALHLPARSAFTLLELILVIAIMAIFTAIAVPRYSGSVDLSRVDAATRKIATDFALARSQAMTSSTVQTVAFSVGTGTYELLGKMDPDHPMFSYTVDVSAEPYKSLLVSATFGGSPTVTFDIYGQPSSAGIVVVRSGSRQKSVVLDANTGRTTIQ